MDPNNNQPAPQAAGEQPVQPPKPTSPPSNGSLAPVVLGILSIVFAWVVLLNIILAVLAIVLGIKQKKQGAKAKATAGIILGFVGIIVSVLLTYFVVTSVSRWWADGTKNKAPVTARVIDTPCYSVQLPEKMHINSKDASGDIYDLELCEVSMSTSGALIRNSKPVNEIYIFSIKPYFNNYGLTPAVSLDALYKFALKNEQTQNPTADVSKLFVPTTVSGAPAYKYTHASGRTISYFIFRPNPYYLEGARSKGSYHDFKVTVSSPDTTSPADAATTAEQYVNSINWR